MSQDALVEVRETDAALVEKAAASIDFNDPALTLSYGADTMNAIAGFADNLLRQVRAKDAGPLGEILTSLLTQVKSTDLDFAADTNPLSRLPFLGSLFNSLERRMAGLKKNHRPGGRHHREPRSGHGGAFTRY
jgi:uncharacterized protein YaaN involved in tellurite resistance